MTWRVKGRRYWADAETEILRREYGRLASHQIAELLGMKRHAVTAKANLMGLTRPRELLGWALPIGTFRVQREAGVEYVWQKVAANGDYKRDWQRYHKVVWVRENGPVPPGKIIVFKPGRRSIDPEKITIDAVEAITRTEMIARNRYRNEIPAELAEVASLRRQLVKAIYRRERRAKQDTGSTEPPVRHA